MQGDIRNRKHYAHSCDIHSTSNVRFDEPSPFLDDRPNNFLPFLALVTSFPAGEGEDLPVNTLT